MALKCIMLFQGNTVLAAANPEIGLRANQHAYGFSENVYYDGGNSPQFRNNMLNLCRARSLLLPLQATLIAVRVYDYDTGGLVTNIPVQVGSSQLYCDEPQVAVLCRTQLGNSKTQRSWWVHNVPDSQVTGGEFTPSSDYAAAFQAYFQQLQNFAWPRSNYPNYTPIVTAQDNGIVTLTVNNPFLVDARVRVTRTTNAAGRRIGGSFSVQATGPGPNRVTLAGWNLGNTFGGHIFNVAPRTLTSFASGGFFPFTVRAGKRNVGSPFEKYRGRRAARR